MKAVLIIDINDELIEDYENLYVEYDLRGELKNDNVVESIRYVEDCPLKPLPQNKDFEWTDSFGIHNFKKGFNACLNEILGDEE